MPLWVRNSPNETRRKPLAGRYNYNMARGFCTFRQRDVTAAVKAAAKAGVRACVEIERATGNIRIIPVDNRTADQPGQATGQGTNEWDGAR
jgi:hypothetical protein